MYLHEIEDCRNMISGTPGVAHFLNVLDAVSTVGGEGSTEQNGEAEAK